MFSSRTRWNLNPNALTRQWEESLKSNQKGWDLTESNPTRVGISYPPELLKRLGQSQAGIYAPTAQGLLTTRQAVASSYHRKGVQPDPQHIFLTCSTSEAYSHLFRLLADPQEEILIPVPSYPLFQHLADLNDVKTVGYRLIYDQRWKIDLESVVRAVGKKTRAIVVVHPNNPTGSYVTRLEWEELIQICAQHQLALIADEVFAEYRYSPWKDSVPKTLGGSPEVLTFALGGLSKWMGLPQMKLAWIWGSGPADLLQTALERLELVADTYLSVNTPVQVAFPGWLKWADSLQEQIRQRVMKNHQGLIKRIKGRSDIEILALEGGWNGILRLASGLIDSEQWCLGLLRQKQVRVHPGYFFDFEEESMVVVSLLPDPAVFEKGIEGLLSYNESLERISR